MGIAPPFRESLDPPYSLGHHLMATKYDSDTLKLIHTAIERFWFDETGEEIGIIKRDRIFEFFNTLIGSYAYNRGVADARDYLQGKLLDLEIDLHEEVKFQPDPTPHDQDQ